MLSQLFLSFFCSFFPPVHISTGASQLDELMGGGVETGSLTEIFGEYRCGKTQLAMQLCVNSQINSKIPGKAIYIDTEGSFRPSRIREMAARHNVEGDEILDNITYGRVYNYEQQNQLLDHAAALMSEEQYKVLVVVSFLQRNYSSSSSSCSLFFLLFLSWLSGICRILSWLSSVPISLAVVSSLIVNRNSTNSSTDCENWLMNSTSLSSTQIKSCLTPVEVRFI